jgi:hypothetical protein
MPDYIYKAEPLLRTFQQKRAPSADEVKQVFDEILARELAAGWDYVQLESVPVQLNPGCLAGLFGRKSEIHYYSLAVFRRPAS